MRLRQLLQRMWATLRLARRQVSSCIPQPRRRAREQRRWLMQETRVAKQERRLRLVWEAGSASTLLMMGMKRR